MNYCPVCKREYKEMGGNKTLQCPVCGSTLVWISDDEMERVRRNNAGKKE
jgi:rRNA maturation endonuclease Nob1